MIIPDQCPAFCSATVSGDSHSEPNRGSGRGSWSVPLDKSSSLTWTDLELTGKIVLITGATDDLGLALAHCLVGEGAAVAICGRDQRRLDAAECGLADQGVMSWPIGPTQNGLDDRNRSTK